MNNSQGYWYKYPHPAVTADCLVFMFHEHRLHILLVKRGGEPYKGCWAFPGGYMEIDETAEQCARRELIEETHATVGHLQQIGAFSAVDRDPRERVITVAYYTLVSPGKHPSVKAGDDASHAQWFPLDELPKLAFDHSEILSEALRHLREHTPLESTASQLLGDTFTNQQLEELQHALQGH